MERDDEGEQCTEGREESMISTFTADRSKHPRKTTPPMVGSTIKPFVQGCVKKGGRPVTWVGGGGMDPKKLATMNVPQLRAIFLEIFGQHTASNNAAWLRRKLAEPPDTHWGQGRCQNVRARDLGAAIWTGNASTVSSSKPQAGLLHGQAAAAGRADPSLIFGSLAAVDMADGMHVGCHQQQHDGKRHPKRSHVAAAADHCDNGSGSGLDESGAWDDDVAGSDTYPDKRPQQSKQEQPTWWQQQSKRARKQQQRQPHGHAGGAVHGERRVLRWAELPMLRLGGRVDVFWPEDDTWWRASITKLDLPSRHMQLLYSNMQSEDLDGDDLVQLVQDGHFAAWTPSTAPLPPQFAQGKGAAGGSARRRAAPRDAESRHNLLASNAQQRRGAVQLLQQRWAAGQEHEESSDDAGGSDPDDDDDEVGRRVADAAASAFAALADGWGADTTPGVPDAGPSPQKLKALRPASGAAARAALPAIVADVARRVADQGLCGYLYDEQQQREEEEHQRIISRHLSRSLQPPPPQQQQQQQQQQLAAAAAAAAHGPGAGGVSGGNAMRARSSCTGSGMDEPTVHAYPQRARQHAQQQREEVQAIGPPAEEPSSTWLDAALLVHLSGRPVGGAGTPFASQPLPDVQPQARQQGSHSRTTEPSTTLQSAGSGGSPSAAGGQGSGAQGPGANLQAAAAAPRADAAGGWLCDALGMHDDDVTAAGALAGMQGFGGLPGEGGDGGYEQELDTMLSLSKQASAFEEDVGYGYGGEDAVGPGGAAAEGSDGSGSGMGSAGPPAEQSAGSSGGNSNSGCTNARAAGQGPHSLHPPQAEQARGWLGAGGDMGHFGALFDFGC